MTKILVSYGWGAGWSTWADKSKEVAEYLPIIEFLESGGDRMELATRDSGCEPEVYHPLVKQMISDLDLGDYFYTGGADGLTVETVDGAYRIDEYDGNESVTTAANFW